MRRTGVIVALLLAFMPARAMAGIDFSPEFYTLVAAAKAGDLDTVRQDLLAGKNPDTPESTSGLNALCYAAISGDTAMVTLLLHNHARVDWRDKVGNTALHWAAAKGNDDVVTALLDAHAKINAQNGQGLTPLMLAVEEGRTDTVRLLLAHDADAQIRDFTGTQAQGWAQKTDRAQIRQLLRKAGGGP